MDELGQGQLPIVMPHYPHMLSEDTEAWSRFLRMGSTDLERVWYDVHVGGFPDQFKCAGKMELKIAQGLYRKRIDVVCKVRGRWWVVEVKPFGSMLSLGQVITYTELFKRDYGIVGTVQPVIVCFERDKDLEVIADDLGVMVIEVGP